MLKSGTIADGLFLIILTVSMAYFINRLKQRAAPQLRTFAAIQAFDEGVARAVEQNRAVFFSPGNKSTMTAGSYAAACNASLQIMRYLAEKCAAAGARFIAVGPPSGAGMLPAMQAVHREAYMAAGKGDQVVIDDVRYPSASGGGASYYGSLEFLAESDTTCIVLVGAFSNDGMALNEWGKTHDCLVISGTTRHMMMFCGAMMADYALFGDEIYAAGTKCAGDEVMVSSLAGADMLKWMLNVIILIGGALALAGVSIIPYLNM